MIREYALDPALISSWDRLRFFTAHFGISAGRLIAKYPLCWSNLVWQHLQKLNLKDGELKRIVEKLASPAFASKFIGRGPGTFDQNVPWLDNAVREHARQAFAALVAQENPKSYPGVLDGDEIDDDHPMWKVQTSWPVPRTAQAMAALAAPLLKLSREILFVDPYFGSLRTRHIRPLGAMLDMLDPRRVARVEYHFATPGDESERSWQACDTLLAPLLPSGMTLKLVVWPPQNMHNRFILTELGGLEFGHGLDDSDGKGQTDDVHLLSPEHHTERWADFQLDLAHRPVAMHHVQRQARPFPSDGRR